MKNKYYITNKLSVDKFCSVKLAELNYNPDSKRNDDAGSLFIAPVISASWNFPKGMLAIYATTNGDAILLGQIENGEVTWFDETSETPGLESIREVLERAQWNHPTNGEGYSYIVEDSI